MSSIKYVPEGVYLVCDKSTCYSQFKITQNKDTTIYSSNLASTGDKWSYVNVKPMGLCLMRGSLCMPSPVLWMNPKGGISVGSNELLLEKSTAKCMFGGTIKIHFTLEAAMEASPWQSVKKKKPSEYIKEGFDWTFENYDAGMATTKSWMQDKGAPQWMSDGVDVVDWSAQFTVGAAEGAVNGVVGMGEVIYDIAQDPVGVGGAVVDMVGEGISDAYDWASKGENWSNAANSTWDWVSNGDNWSNAASSSWDWVKGNPRKVGNVAGEVGLEVGTAVSTGGTGNAAKAGGTVAKETVEAGTKKVLQKTEKEALKKAEKEALKKAEKEALKKAEKEALKKAEKEALKKAEKEALKKAEKEAVGEIPEVITKKKVPYDQLGKEAPCFLQDTFIKTKLGLTPIQSIKIGDLVLVYNFKREFFEYRAVIDTYKNWAEDYYCLETSNGKTINVTGGHLFWLDKLKRWSPVKELKQGDILKDIVSNPCITKISHIKNVVVDTYNLGVESIHNYLIEENGVLVHNKGKVSKFENPTKTITEIYEVFDKKTGKTVYVGQTKQGVNVRFDQHIKDKPGWNKNKYDIRSVKKGDWTPYEASAWEQHYIDKNGGKQNLLNKRNEITKKKYDKFADLHNPCK